MANGRIIVETNFILYEANGMKYKILTDGHRFFIKSKSLLFWSYVMQHNSNSFFDYPKAFDTENDAQTFANKRWGEVGQRVREIRVC